jgi:hypothetical protein
MNKHRKILKKILIIVAIILFVFLLFPRAMVIGGLDIPYGDSEYAYLEEYSCFGLKYNFCPSSWMDFKCVKFCFGMVYNKKCYNEIFNNKSGVLKTDALCE